MCCLIRTSFTYVKSGRLTATKRKNGIKIPLFFMIKLNYMKFIYIIQALYSLFFICFGFY